METLPSKGLLPIWSPGVNGSSLTDAEIRKNTTALCAATCTRPSIGIGMAHLNAWASIVKNNDDYALVVEDDVTFVPDFYQSLVTAIQHVPADYDILYLGCFGCTSDSSLLTLGGKAAGLIDAAVATTSVNAYIDRPTTVVGAHAYIVSRKGATRLLQHLTGRLWTHIDYCMQLLVTNKLVNAYVSRPRIAFQTSTDMAASTNTGRVHPVLLQKAVSGLYLDEAFSANYFLTVTAAKVGPFPITVSSFLFLVAGLLLAFLQPSLLLLSAVFGVFSIPDLLVESNPYSILLHYVLLVTPTLLFIRRG